MILIEAGPRLLPAFPERLSRPRRALVRLGVEVRPDAPVTACDADGVTVGDERIEAAPCCGPPGSPPRPPRWLGAENDRAGRVMVGPTSRCRATQTSS